jgi:hypothetical protein
MAWQQASQADLVSILYYTQDQFGYDQIGSAMERVSRITPIAGADRAIARIELLISEFWEIDKAISKAAIGSSRDGRMLAKADVFEWSTNPQMGTLQDNRQDDRLKDIRERIRLALGISYGPEAPPNIANQKCVGRRVRS